MDSTQLRFGVISTARITTKMVKVIQRCKHSILVAIASRSSERMKQYAVDNNLPKHIKLYSTYQKIIDDPNVDVVYVPLPSNLKYEWMLKAARAKKHVLAEKPFVSSQEVRDVIRECEKNKVYFMDNTFFVHHVRFPLIRMKYIDPNKTKLVRVHSSTCGLQKNIMDIRYQKQLEPLGCLGDYGFYSIRGILWAFDYEMPLSVSASRFLRNEVPVSVTGFMNFEKQRVASFYCSFNEPRSRELKLVFANDLVVMVDDFVSPRNSTENVEKAKAKCGIEIECDERAYFYVKMGSHEEFEKVICEEKCVQVDKVMDDFTQEILGKRKKRDWGTESLKTMIVIDAICKSAQTKKEVKLNN